MRYVWCPDPYSYLLTDGTTAVRLYGRIYWVEADGIPFDAQCCNEVGCSPWVEIVPAYVPEPAALIWALILLILLAWSTPAPPRRRNSDE